MTTLNATCARPKVLELLGANPALPYSIIAEEVGVSRERVRQIARHSGYPPRYGIPRPQICPVCRETFYSRRLYCSSGCKHQVSRKAIILSCHICGKPVVRTPGNLRSKSGKYFCNRECFKRWVGRSYITKSRKRAEP